jgi:hypothetical protein
MMAANRSSRECSASDRIPRLAVIIPTTNLNSVSENPATMEDNAAFCLLFIMIFEEIKVQRY